MYRLTPVLKHYDWGSAHAIPSLLGLPDTGEPVAEAWWGAHPTFPSMAQVEGRDVPLTEVLRDDAVGQLGATVAERWAGALPYLVKVLGVAKPLSIQVHPSRAQAVEGFDAEERAGVPVDGAARSFRDRSHKPELLVALTEMTVMAGLREPQDVAADLRRIDGAQARELSALVELSGDGFAAYTRAVLGMPREADVLTALSRTADEAASPSHRAAAHALTHHHGDPGALLALALNTVHLTPGQAVFMGHGVVHSYQSGLGIEVMANSDNVVRAGLTSKPIDVDLLLRLADMTPGEIVEVTPAAVNGVATFRTPAHEFRLTTVDNAAVTLERGPHIVIALEGDTRVTTAGATDLLERGAAVYVGDREGAVEVESRAQAVVVCAGIDPD